MQEKYLIIRMNFLNVWVKSFFKTTYVRNNYIHVYLMLAILNYKFLRKLI